MVKESVIEHIGAREEQSIELPHNIDAEQTLLGNLMVNNEDLNKVSDFLSSNHFYVPVHQRIYEAIQKFHDKGILANPITLKNYFDQDESLKEYGGHKYLADLAGLSLGIINMYDYGKSIYELALKRELISIGKDIVNDAREHKFERSAHDQIENAEKKLYDLSNDDLERNKGFAQLKTPLQEAINKAQSAYQNKGKVSGIASNFTDLDELLGGFQDSDLVIMAGRPSMGKTAVSVNIAYNACKNLVANHEALLKGEDAEEHQGTKPKSVGFFSLEMSSEQIATRMLSMVSGVSSSKLRTGHIDEDEFSDIANATKTLQDMPFYIDDTPSISVAALRTKARRLKRMHNLGIIIVDYLQLMRADSSNREMNRVQEISEITQGLKAIAKELHIPVIALSQLSRAVEQREDKRPLLSDLRESGSIEQDADIVIFIYREEYYLMRKKPKEGTEQYAKWQADMEDVSNITELIVSKHRNGPIGSVRLFFDAHYTRFSNLTQEYESA
ncbi:MAG: replicative DNA helicase [Rickettsiales bacterium]